MSNENKYEIRVMTIDDYDEVYSLWQTIHDGRRGCLYHVCVDEHYRKCGIGKSMVVACMRALQAEHINKVSIIAFKVNELGNHFWKEEGWTFREDLNYYDFTLNEENITRFNK